MSLHNRVSTSILCITLISCAGTGVRPTAGKWTGQGDICKRDWLCRQWVEQDTEQQAIDTKESGAVSNATKTEIPTKETTQNTATKESMSLDEAKKKCIELGFKDKTELLGSCVLKLSK